VNQQIRISPIRLVSQTGEQLGILPTDEALQMAEQAGLDLVEVAPNERPPVCRIMDFGKFKYQQKKRQHAKTKQHHTQLKEVRVRPRTDTHDIAVKLNKARQFLSHKDKVLISMQFRGRELAHVDVGKAVVERMIEQLEDIGKVEKAPSMEGRRISAILAPRA
jgi:translation initiation factor IF-3